MGQLCQISEETVNGGLVYGIVIIFGGEAYTYKYISCVRKNVERLISRLENEVISPVHFNDIVRDYILELAYAVIDANGL